MTASDLFFSLPYVSEQSRGLIHQLKLIIKFLKTCKVKYKQKSEALNLYGVLSILVTSHLTVVLLQAKFVIPIAF